MKQSENSSNNQPYLYDPTEESLKRISLRYDPYIESFDQFLTLYNKKTDGDEKLFIENEVEVFEEVSGYLRDLDEGSNDSYQIYELEKRYKPYLKIIREALRYINTLDNSLERKCIFLKNRLTELNTSSNNTLGQRLLLIKYLDRSKKIVLSQIHPDNTGQAQVLKFLMNAGYQNVRSGLGKNIDNYKNEKDLKILLDLLKPYERYFKEIIIEIEKDLRKINM